MILKKVTLTEMRSNEGHLGSSDFIKESEFLKNCASGDRPDQNRDSDCYNLLSGVLFNLLFSGKTYLPYNNSPGLIKLYHVTWR